MRLAASAFVAAFLCASCALSHSPHQDAAVDVVHADVEAGRLDGDVISDVPGADVETGCSAGTTLCGGACVAINTPQRCGSCSNDCTALPGVSASAVRCTAGACDLMGACQPNLADCDHAAANGCETSIVDSANCGACGTACSGATPVCARDTGTGVYACASGCAAGMMLCPSGGCANLATDVMHCGACGTVCSAPVGATASCTGGTCAWACNTGSHMCGAQCLRNDSTAGCGTSCTACPTDANGTATCTAGACGITCATGFHLCAGVCVSSASVMSCGASCSPCVPPANATSTCTAGACGSTCTAAFHDCGGTCSNNASVATCGTRCAACTAPTNGTATCTAGACGFNCNPGFVAMAGACVSANCGNQMLDAGETCDDGNTVASDGCSATCQVEAGTIVNAMCPPSAGITITHTGTYIYSGDTTGQTNSLTSCGASGGEQAVAATINVGGAFTVTVTLRPTTWDPVLRHGGSCATLMCADANGPGATESFTATFGGTPPGPFYWVADGKGGMNEGPWTLTVLVM